MRQLVYMAVFAAVAVTLGLAFLTIPNLEFVTVTFFLAGYFLGPWKGIITAATGEFIYSLLNPLGTAAPPLLIAQIIGMVLTAFVGGMLSPVKNNRGNKSSGLFTPNQPMNKNIRWKSAFFFGTVGFCLTVIFDLLTTTSFLIFAGLSFTKFIASIIYGMYFYLIHIGMNTVIFAVLVPIVINVFRKQSALTIRK